MVLIKIFFWKFFWKCVAIFSKYISVEKQIWNFCKKMFLKKMFFWKKILKLFYIFFGIFLEKYLKLFWKFFLKIFFLKKVFWKVFENFRKNIFERTFLTLFLKNFKEISFWIISEPFSKIFCHFYFKFFLKFHLKIFFEKRIFDTFEFFGNDIFEQFLKKSWTFSKFCFKTIWKKFQTFLKLFFGKFSVKILKLF